MRVFSCKFATCFQNNFLRRNFSLVARYSLKFTRCSLLFVKSLVTRCKIRSSLVAEVARCKKSLVTCCRSCSLQKSLVTRCTSCLLQKITRYLLQNSLVTCCKNSLVARYEKNPRTNVYLKPIKLGEFYLFILYFQLTKNRERFRTQ